MIKKVIRSLIIFVFLGTIVVEIFQMTMQNNGNYVAEEAITWQLNDDGTYTFWNNTGAEKSVYMWQVLDAYNEEIYKTSFAEDAFFIYDLEDNRDLTIKGYVRTYSSDTDYDQVSFKVPANAVLGREQYEVVSTKISDDTLHLIRNQVITHNELSVESILGGVIYNDLDISLPMDWTCSNNESLTYEINSFRFLDEVYREYEQTGDDSLIDFILSYIVDWIEQNGEIDLNDNGIWGGDAVARRVAKMCYYYYMFGDRLSKSEREMIETSLSDQAALLARETFYEAKHNHGMYQDIALLSYALLLDSGNHAEAYIATALSRSGEYFDYVFTTDGIHKEHSPTYAYNVYQGVVFYQQLTENISSGFSAKMKGLSDKAESYLVQLIKPDGTWPSIGDSTSGYELRTDIEELFDNSEYLYVISGGSNGICPEEDAVFSEGGYAIMRSSWDDSADEATWMMFLASTFSSTHKHGDDLSFLLYHKGDLFVEAGSRNYQYLEDETAWCYSSYAHNTLVVDGEAFPVHIGESGFQSVLPSAYETGITDYDLSGDTKTVTGVQKRYENVEQTRTLAYDKENDIVTVTDQLKAEDDIQATFIYHIAEGVDVEECADGWNLYRNGELVANVIVTSDNETELETITETEGEYPYYTWIFSGNEEPEIGSLLLVNMSCEAGNSEMEMMVVLK